MLGHESVYHVRSIVRAADREHTSGRLTPLATTACSIVFIRMLIGIGQGRVTANLSGAPIDRALLISDTEVVAMVSTIYNQARM